MKPLTIRIPILYWLLHLWWIEFESENVQLWTPLFYIGIGWIRDIVQFDILEQGITISLFCKNPFKEIEPYEVIYTTVYKKVYKTVTLKECYSHKSKLI